MTLDQRQNLTQKESNCGTLKARDSSRCATLKVVISDVHPPAQRLMFSSVEGCNPHLGHDMKSKSDPAVFTWEQQSQKPQSRNHHL